MINSPGKYTGQICRQLEVGIKEHKREEKSRPTDRITLSKLERDLATPPHAIAESHITGCDSQILQRGFERPLNACAQTPRKSEPTKHASTGRTRQQLPAFGMELCGHQQSILAIRESCRSRWILKTRRAIRSPNPPALRLNLRTDTYPFTRSHTSGRMHTRT